jgi:hypothetical protein
MASPSQRMIAGKNGGGQLVNWGKMNFTVTPAGMVIDP